jgi:uncharacterized protein (TIGR03083 family)
MKSQGKAQKMHKAATDHGDALVEQTRMFAELISGRDLSVQVPTTPGWSLARLTGHLGRGHTWASQIVARQSEMSPGMMADTLSSPVDWTAVMNSGPAYYTAEIILDWLPGTAQALVDAVEHEGPGVPVWTTAGPRPAAFWLRRQLCEAIVHRADAFLALGADYQLAPHLAADALLEFLERVVVQVGGQAGIPERSKLHPMPLDDGQVLRLRPADLEQAGWTIVRNGERLAFSPHHDGDATELRGPALDLLLTLVRRRDVADTQIGITGDAAVLQNWLRKTPY